MKKKKKYISILDNLTKNIQVNSNFTIKHRVSKNKPEDEFKIKKEEKLKKQEFKMKVYKLDLTKKQKHICKKWNYCLTKMYNTTLHYIKINKIYDFRKVRNNIKENKKEFKNIPSHILDKAIREACKNYKSALTNYKNGNIKKFRIRYRRLKNRNFTINIEPCYMKKNKEITILGKIKFKNGNFLEEIKNEVSIFYNYKLNEYKIGIPVKVEKENIEQSNNYISLDPGIRTFMTGISDNGFYKFNQSSQDFIKNKLLKLDNISKENKNYKKVEKHIYSKIKNHVTEFHNKIINYLTLNFKNILIGNFSIKRVIKKEFNLNSMVKRIGLSMRFYEFKEKLKNKCFLRNVNYKEIDESYTSRTCSSCGCINNKLGGNKIFKCLECPSIMDRDLNGAINILYKN